MDPFTIAALISAGSQIIGGVMQSDAASSATKQAAGAAQTAYQNQQRAYNEARRIYAPYVAGGYAGYNALANRFGLGGPGGGSVVSDAIDQTTPGAAPSPAEILANRPDVLAEFQRLSPNNIRNNLGIDYTPEAFATWWWNQHGQYEPNNAGIPRAGGGEASRTSVIGAQGMGGDQSSPLPGGGSGKSENALAMAGGGYAGTSPLEDPSKGPGGASGGTYGNADGLNYRAPDAYQTPAFDQTYSTPAYDAPAPYSAPTYDAPAPHAAPTFDQAYQAPAYTAPAFDQSYTAPTFDRTYEEPTFSRSWTEPTYTPPPEFSFSADSFKDNEAYKFAQEQGSGRVLASASATGSLKSGAALKALQDRGQQTAYQFYAPERDAAYARYADSRDFGRQTFDADRNFSYGEYRDARGDFNTDRDFSYGAYRDARGDYQDDRDFGYGAYRDTRGDFERDRDFGRTTYQDDRDFGYGAYRDTRGDFERDRTYGRAAYEDDRDFGRSAYETDRIYGRDSYENDRDFGRTTYQDDRDFGYGATRDARSDYQDDRDFGYGQYIDTRNFDRSRYADDRNYLTDRYDRQTDDLFRFTGMGANATTATANAAIGDGTNAANYATTVGDLNAGNALQQGNIWSGVVGGVGGTASAYLTRGGQQQNALSAYLAGADKANPYLF